mgnify:CR=1 FL=1
MEWLRKITDFIMPIEVMPEEEQEKAEVKKASASATEAKKIEMPTASTATTGALESEVGAVRKVAATGGGYGSALKFSEPAPATTAAAQAAAVRPPLTVIDSKSKELNVKIYAPTSFDQASEIAAEILSKNAAVVNYEYVDAPVQLRLCDFLNGVCYVTDGYTDKISEKIFLYVPDGVETVDIAEAVSTIGTAQLRRGVFAS